MQDTENAVRRLRLPMGSSDHGGHRKRIPELTLGRKVALLFCTKMRKQKTAESDALSKQQS